MTVDDVENSSKVVLTQSPKVKEVNVDDFVEKFLQPAIVNGEAVNAAGILYTKECLRVYIKSFHSSQREFVIAKIIAYPNIVQDIVDNIGLAKMLLQLKDEDLSKI